MGAIRNDNIIIVVFDDEKKVETPLLYQYDKGIILEFKDVPDTTDVQFSNIYVKETINKTIINGKVEIPDSLLEEDSGIVGYIKYINADSEWTEKYVAIPVKARPMPADYISEDDEPTFRADMQAIMEETKQAAEEAKEAIKNLELTDEQISQIASQIDVSGKANRFIGTGSPSGNANDFPNVKYGDIYFDKNNTNNAYMAVYFPTSNVVGWSPLPLLGYLNANFYSKTDTDNKLKSYDTSEKVDEKIKNATSNVDLSEYTKIWSGTEPPVNGVASNYQDVKSGDIYIMPTGAFYRANVTSNKLYVSWVEMPISAEVIKKFVAKEYPTSGYNVGDIFVDTDDSYKARIRTNDEWVQLAYLEEVNALLRSYYNKTETENEISDALENYDTSEEVDDKISNAITEALLSIPIAEGSEF